MTTEIPARIIPYAVADLLDARAREAWHYLDRWEAGRRAGVLARDLRSALDVELQATEAQRIIGGWVQGGARGVLVVCSDPGLGKTLSAVRWLLHRHDKGRRTAWWPASNWPYDFDARDSVLSMLADASALVIDDLGEGESSIATMAAEQRSKVAAKIVGRFNDARPTLILSNATEAEVSEWIGGRMVDRMRVDGGVHTLRPAPSMRKREAVEVDEQGRSQRWHAARKLVDLIGVERDGDDWTIGRKLESIPGRVDLVIRELELDRAEVARRATELLELDREAIARISNAIGEQLPIDVLDWSALAPWMHERERQAAAKAEAEQADKMAKIRAEIASVGEALAFTEITPPAAILPLHVDGSREIALRYGLHIVRLDDEHGHAVRHSERVLARGQWSQAQAWWVAAQLIGREVTRREEAAACG